MKKIVLLSIFSLCAAVNLSAQRSIKSGMATIEKSYAKSFAYDASLKVNVAYSGEKLTGESIEGDLERLFRDSEFEWQMVNDHIILKQAKLFKISGHVVDATSGEPLVGASILARKKFTFTDDSGRFELHLKRGIEELKVIYISYSVEKIAIDVAQEAHLNIEMRPDENRIGDVVVTAADAKSEVISEARGNGHVALNVEKMEAMPSLSGTQDILKFVQSMPGISGGGDGSSNIYIRGGLADQTQILLDDVPIYNTSHAFGFISLFGAETVDMVDIYKGYTAPSYGGRLSGVVDMQMREGDRNKHNQTLQVGAITLEGSANGSLAGGRGTYAVSSRTFAPHPFLEALHGTGMGLPIYNFYDIAAKFSYDLGRNHNHRISLSSYNGRDMYKQKSTEVMTTTEQTAIDMQSTQGEEYNSKTSMNWSSSMVSLRLASRFNDRLFMSHALYYSHTNNGATEHYKSSRKETQSDMLSRMDEVGARSNLRFRTTDRNTIEMGAHASYQRLKPQHFTFIKDGVQNEADNYTKGLMSYSLHVNDNLQVGKFEFDIGVRASLYDNSISREWCIEPRLSATYNASATTSLWASAVRNSQPLFSIGEEYISIPLSFWTPYHDGGLQTAEQVSVGVRQEFWSSLVVTAELYAKRTSNLTLIYDSDEFLLSGLGAEHGDGRALGAELMLQYTKGRFSAVGSYAYSRSEIVLNDVVRPFEYDTPHAANLLAIYKTVERVDREHSLSLNITYRTGRAFMLGDECYEGSSWDGLGFMGMENNFIINYDPLSVVRLHDYFRADIGYSMFKRLRNGSRTWQISISNLTNRLNPNFIIPSSNTGSYTAVSLLPIMPSFSYTRKF